MTGGKRPSSIKHGRSSATLIFLLTDTAVTMSKVVLSNGLERGGDAGPNAKRRPRRSRELHPQSPGWIILINN
ncbi:MAG: hypothetical protein GY803_01625 [Chloroflexi bacterium]|nr:hypothetical protein [Chloroflexota bacterium]